MLDCSWVSPSDAHKSGFLFINMQLSELKILPLDELILLGEACGVENAARVKRQDVVFAILKNKSKLGEDIDGGGVLEILQDGFGFLRSPDSSYLAGPDDI